MATVAITFPVAEQSAWQLTKWENCVVRRGEIKLSGTACRMFDTRQKIANRVGTDIYQNMDMHNMPT
jgi:hypothetical protein